MRAAGLIAAGVALLICSACGAGQHPGGEDPQSVLRAYAQALEQGRADDAYRLLSDEARRGISLEAFRRMVQDDPEGVREIGRALERPTAPAVVTATVMVMAASIIPARRAARLEPGDIVRGTAQ